MIRAFLEVVAIGSFIAVDIVWCDRNVELVELVRLGGW